MTLKIPKECRDILLAYTAGEFKPAEDLPDPAEYSNDPPVKTDQVLCILVLAGLRLKSARPVLRYQRGVYSQDRHWEDYPDTSTPPTPGGLKGMESYHPTQWGRSSRIRPNLHEIIEADGMEANYLYSALTFWTLHIAYSVCVETEDDMVDFVRGLSHLPFHCRKLFKPDLIDQCIMSRAELVPLYYEGPQNMLAEFLHLSRQIAGGNWYDWEDGIFGQHYVETMKRRIASFLNGERKSI